MAMHVMHGFVALNGCRAFQISQACYRYEAKHHVENEEIANWPLRLMDNNRNRGLRLCFLYLPNVVLPGITSACTASTGSSSRTCASALLRALMPCAGGLTRWFVQRASV